MELKETIQKRYDTAYNNQRNKLLIFNAIDDVLNQNTKDFTNNAKLGSPYAWAAVEMVVPRMVSKNPTLEYQPREDSDTQKAEKANSLWKYWSQKVGLLTVLTSWTKTSASYGTGILKLIYRTEKRTVTKFVYERTLTDPLSGITQTYKNSDGTPLIGADGSYEQEEVEVTVWDDPYPEIISNNYLFMSPGATDPKNANWIIHKYWKPLEDLKSENKLTGIYKNLNKLEGTQKTDNIEEKNRHASTGQTITIEDNTVDQIEILEMWDRISGKQVMLANNCEIILDRKFPYWHGKLPFIKLVDSLVPMEWYGKGEVEPIMKDIYVIDTLTNQRIDELTGIIKKWKIKDNIDEDELFESDVPIHVENQDDAELVNFPNATSGNFDEIQTRQASVQNTLGVADYTSNADSNSDRTAKGMTIKNEQLNARFAHKIQLFEEALKELGEQVLALYQQFLTKPLEFRILGEEDPTLITPQDIAGDYDCIPEAGSTQPTDKYAEKQEVTNALGLFQNSPYVKPGAIEEKALEKFFPKDYQTMIQDPEQVKSQQLNELLQSPQVQQLIQGQAEQMAQKMTNGVQNQQDERKTQIEDKMLNHQMDLEKIQAQAQAKNGISY